MKYVQESLAEGKAQGLALPSYVADWDEVFDYSEDPDWEQAIWLIKDDGTSEYISGDGGEPEDNTLNRDWCWIVGELNRAYARGFTVGYNAAYGEMQTENQV